MVTAAIVRSRVIVIASPVYWPIARISKMLIGLGKDASNFPLHHYAEMSFVMFENDALDRFEPDLRATFH